MPRRHRSLVVTVASAITLAALVVGLAGQEPEPGRGYPSTDWPFAGGNWSSSRYSTLDEIATATLDRLGAAWVAPLPGGAASRSTPVVQDGAIYVTGGANVFAFDAGSGDLIWRWQPDPDAGRVVSWQGVVVAGDVVVFGTRSGEVIALSRDTGELVWATRVGSPEQTRGEVVTTAPMYARGKVFVGLANGDIGGQGRVLALDAATGEVAWTFFVVPRPGEFGHETWPQDSDSWEYGGGGVWLVGTVDPDLGMVYFSTGNPVPMFGGELREGDNLFTASVLALDMETGERRWHYQVVRHDIWDADIATPLLLYDTTVDGEPVKAVAAMRADGYLFLFNRETGEPLLPIEEREVPQDAHQLTVPTQPFPTQTETILFECSYWRDRVPPPFQLNCSSYTPPSVDEQTVVAPGVPIPLVRVTPMAFSPDTGYIYAQGRAHVGRARRFADPFVWNTARFHLTLPDAVGVLAAVDTATGRVVWKNEMPSAFLGVSGPLVTAGGLLFRGSPGGQVEAYDVRTGDRRWAFRTSEEGSRLRPGPASTYELDGTQYIAVAMGPALWAFALDGDLPSRGEPSPDPPVDDQPAGPAPRETDEIDTATLLENPRGAVGGRRYAFDEHNFNPVRARVTAGTRVRFTNNGEIAHTVAARDGSWSTATLAPGLWDFVTFDEPGTFLYHCEEHPWAVGEITVDP